MKHAITACAMGTLPRSEQMRSNCAWVNSKRARLVVSWVLVGIGVPLLLRAEQLVERQFADDPLRSVLISLGFCC